MQSCVEAEPRGVGGGLAAVLQAHLLQDVLQVGADRVLGDEQSS